jgi:clan AA aspartic protease
MALTFITVKLINPLAQKKTFRRKFLVDSGAVYSVVDKAVLKDLGIKKTRTLEFILSNGQTIKRSVGEVTFDIKGERATSPVVFGDTEIFLLGAVTLETFGYILDPISRKLRSLPMLI